MQIEIVEKRLLEWCVRDHAKFCKKPPSLFRMTSPLKVEATVPVVSLLDVYKIFEPTNH